MDSACQAMPPSGPPPSCLLWGLLQGNFERTSEGVSVMPVPVQMRKLRRNQVSEPVTGRGDSGSQENISWAPMLLWRSPSGTPSLPSAGWSGWRHRDSSAGGSLLPLGSSPREHGSPARLQEHTERNACPGLSQLVSVSQQPRRGQGDGKRSGVSQVGSWGRGGIGHKLRRPRHKVDMSQHRRLSAADASCQETR